MDCLAPPIRCGCGNLFSWRKLSWMDKKKKNTKFAKVCSFESFPLYGYYYMPLCMPTTVPGGYMPLAAVISGLLVNSCGLTVASCIIVDSLPELLSGKFKPPSIMTLVPSVYLTVPWFPALWWRHVNFMCVRPVLSLLSYHRQLYKGY